MSVVLVLVIVLVVTNLVTLGALFYYRYRPPDDEPGEPAVEAALAATPSSAGRTSGIRQVISIEILNPIELAATRGRMLGIAGSFAPSFTRRIVYDQTSKILRHQLTERHVAADVHVHTLRPVSSPTDAQPVDRPARAADAPLDIQPVSYLDEVDAPVDDLPRPQPPVQ